MVNEIRNKTRKVFDIIADSWSNLYTIPIEQVKEFCLFAKKTGLVLDIGCGNGRNLIPFLERGFPAVGIDFSKNMIKEAKKFLEKRNLKAKLLVADVLNLPFKDSKFDYIIYVSTLHHLPSRKLRIKSLKEVKRVLKPDGKVLISVWKRRPAKYLLQRIKCIGEKKKEFGDVWIGWKYHGKIYKRFYHLYSLKELESDIKISGLNIESIYSESIKGRHNIFAKCSK